MKQQYVKEPTKVEFYKVFNNKTDIILRKNIVQEVRINDANDNKAEKIWICDEICARIYENVTKTEIEKNFELWWDKIESLNSKSINYTQEERLVELEKQNKELDQRCLEAEAGLIELASMISFGGEQ